MSNISTPPGSGSNGGSSVTVTTFTSSGTWNKAATTKFVQVYGWGGGGGGGSGRRGATGAAGGGSGAGSGGGFFFEGPESFFLNSVVVTIGAGATGGSAITADNTDGNPGGIPTMSSFGKISEQPGGASIVAAAGGNGTGNAASGVGYRFSLGTSATVGPLNSGSGTLTTGQATSAFTIQAGTFLCPIPGAGGGGASTATGFAGGTPVSSLTPSGATLLAGGTPGSSPAGDGGNGDSISATNNSGIMSGGGGGGGGAGGSGVVSTGGKGGNGGFPGGAGGGGGGSLNGNNSGAGGNGANGQIIVIEYS